MIYAVRIGFVLFTFEMGSEALRFAETAAEHCKNSVEVGIEIFKNEEEVNKCLRD